MEAPPVPLASYQALHIKSSFDDLNNKSRTAIQREGTAGSCLSSRRAAEVVQFSSPVFYAREEAGHAVVDVMRIGSAEDRSSVRFSTVDVSARAGVRYRACAGEVVFEPGELLKSIDIEIIEDDQFDTTLQFAVHLEQPVNCMLGRYLKSSRVFIVDDDIFPANRFRASVTDGSGVQLAEESFSLLLAYMKFTLLRVPTIWWKSLLTVLIDQVQNLYYLMTIYLRIYLVDVALNVSDESTSARLLIPGDRSLTVAALAMLLVLPNFVLLAGGLLKVGSLEMGKTIRTHLQVNLFRKYLNYSEGSKEKVPIQDLTTAMTADIPMLVEDGYMSIFDLLQHLGRISVMSIFMLKEQPVVGVPLIAAPLVILLFIRSRQGRHVELEDDVVTAQAGSTGMLISACESFALIRDYRQRESITELFQQKLRTSFDAHNAMNAFKFFSDQFVPWLTLIGTALYLFFGAESVLMNRLSIGSFLAMLDVCNRLGTSFQDLYKNLESGMQAGSPLVEITRMMNYATDVEERLARNRARRDFMKLKLDAHIKEATMLHSRGQGGMSEHVASFFDTLPICIEGLRVGYIKALSDVRVQVSPNTLVYITGGHGTGKTTLTRILSDVMVPPRGQTLYSSHNRCLNVSNTPSVIGYLNLYENLTFGATDPHPDHVRSIFCRLGLGHSWLLAKLDAELAELAGQQGRDLSRPETDALLAPAQPESVSLADNDHWVKRLSAAERKRVHIVRAFVYNAEVLVINKPLGDLDQEDVEELLAVMREFVDNRGIGTDKLTVERRRPRTCFFSSGLTAESKRSVEIVDIIWHLTEEHGLVVEIGGKGNASKHMPPNAGHQRAQHVPDRQPLRSQSLGRTTSQLQDKDSSCASHASDPETSLKRATRTTSTLDAASGNRRGRNPETKLILEPPPNNRHKKDGTFCWRWRQDSCTPPW